MYINCVCVYVCRCMRIHWRPAKTAIAPATAKITTPTVPATTPTAIRRMWTAAEEAILTQEIRNNNQNNWPMPKYYSWQRYVMISVIKTVQFTFT